MSETAALAERIEQAFAQIARTRMADVPVTNPALDVAMRGLRRLGEDMAGILVTPWFMNFMLIPAAPQTRRIGEKRDLALPSGRYQAIWNHEEGIGGYWSCSLFSPMFEFADQAAALATADAALAEMLAAPEPDAPGEDGGMAMVWAGALPARAPEPEPAREPAAAEDGPVQLSRRALFRLPAEQAARP